MEKPQIIIFTSYDKKIKVDVIIENNSVWLTQQQIAQLFKKERTVITKHINNIFVEKELFEISNVQKMHFINSKKPVNIYSIDVVIAVGYRVKSENGKNFRIWANEIVKEYMIKGYALNDDLLKNNLQPLYFEELLSRIRDIRSSEKVFWRKILDLYSTSIDYDPQDPTTIEFFKTIQNKMHYAASGNTAAEIIYYRIDSQKKTWV